MMILDVPSKIIDANKSTLNVNRKQLSSIPMTILFCMHRENNYYLINIEIIWIIEYYVEDNYRSQEIIFQRTKNPYS